MCRQSLTRVQRGFVRKKRDIKLNEQIKMFKTENRQRCSSYTRTYTCARAHAQVNERWWGFDRDTANLYKIWEILTLIKFLKLVCNKHFLIFLLYDVCFKL